MGLISDYGPLNSELPGFLIIPLLGTREYAWYLCWENQAILSHKQVSMGRRKNLA